MFIPASSFYELAIGIQFGEIKVGHAILSRRDLITVPFNMRHTGYPSQHLDAGGPFDAVIDETAELIPLDAERCGEQTTDRILEI